MQIQSPVGWAQIATASQGRSDTQKDVAKAAGDFEALLISQLLRSARGGGDGWLGTGDDQSASSLLDMAEDQLAQAMAGSGGMGLAQMVVRGLNASGSANVRTKE